MSRLAAVALILIGMAIPACAQHAASRSSSGSHGFSASRGFAGHFSSASRGGFSAAAPNRFAAFPRSTASRQFVAQRSRAGNASRRQPYLGDSRHRRPYISPYGVGLPYAVGIDPYFAGYPNDIGYDDSSDSPAPAPDGYGLEPGEPPPPPFSPYQPAYEPPHPSQVTGNEEAVTLVFKDGRPSEQIHNYVLTPTTLFVGDQHRREIPIDQLDLAATTKVNRDAGVDFHLPTSPSS